MKGSVMGKLLIVIIVLAILAAAIIYIFRYEIFEYSAEALVRKHLPDYMSVDDLVFDFKEGMLRVKGLGIKNPPGYDERFLARVESIFCKYRLQGKTIVDGLEVTEITAERPEINIERLRNGRINLNDMNTVMAEGRAANAASEAAREAKSPGTPQTLPGGKDVSEFLKITDTLLIKDGKVEFNDRALGTKPVRTTFEEVNGELVLRMEKGYKSVTAVSSEGRGFVNGDETQRIGWRISLDPQRQALTMSNRFQVSGVEITQFRPYYDPYSPIEIRSGRFSGDLVFDFDNGNIGSMNTVKLSGFRFVSKKDDSAAAFWDTTVPDLIKYLQSASGEIVFDFKIKGDMREPRFYPGPIVKRAIQNMAVDKISEAIQQATQPSESAGAEGGATTDAEKMMETIKALLKK